MLLWKRKKNSEKQDALIEKFEEKEQKYQADIEQKNKLILKYQKQEEEYLKDLEKQQKKIQELQQKLAKIEPWEEEYKKKLNFMETHLNSALKNNLEVTPRESTYLMMERIARKSTSNQQSSTSLRNTQTSVQNPFSSKSKDKQSSHQILSQMKQFNPFK